MLCLKIAGRVANRVDPNESPHSAASHLELHCLLRLSKIHTVNTLNNLVCCDRHIQVEEIAKTLGISQSSVSTILHDHLGMPKLPES